MKISHLTPTFADIKTWVRSAAVSVNQLITGKQDASDNLTSLAGLDLTGHSGDAVVVTAGEDGFELSAAAGGGISQLTGDVTAGPGSGSQAATIPNDTVTYAKIQNVSATDKLLGRSTAGAGDIEEIACTAAGRALLDDANAAAQRTTLGLAIGTDVQAYDADLAALAANSTNGLWAHTGAGTGAARTITAGAGISVTNGDGVSGNPTIAKTNPDVEAAVTIPVVSGFSWRNQGTAAATDTATGINFQAVGGSTNIRFLKAANPASFTSFTATTRAKNSVFPQFAGGITNCIILRNSANGRIIVFGDDSNGTRLRYQRWSAYGTFNADLHASVSYAGCGLFPWKRVRISGGTINFEISADGVNWDGGAITEAVATYISAIDEVGIGCVATASDWAYSTFNHFSAP